MANVLPLQLASPLAQHPNYSSRVVSDMDFVAWPHCTQFLVVLVFPFLPEYFAGPAWPTGSYHLDAYIRAPRIRCS
jgi:hypothetical protein